MRETSEPTTVKVATTIQTGSFVASDTYPALNADELLFELIYGRQTGDSITFRFLGSHFSDMSSPSDVTEHVATTQNLRTFKDAIVQTERDAVNGGRFSFALAARFPFYRVLVRGDGALAAGDTWGATAARVTKRGQ